MNKLVFTIVMIVMGVGALQAQQSISKTSQVLPEGRNPIIRDIFTADPATMVYKGRLYLYVGHDVAKVNEMFNMTEWLCYSTDDMKHWTAHGPIMKPTDFAWAKKDAWASQVIEKNGKFYLYTTVTPSPPLGGKAIGVAVSASPTGPFIDAKGSALVTDETTPSLNWSDDIDPTIMIDDDGTAWLAWGNPNCYLAKLKPNMTEIDGTIQTIRVPNYTEGPWLHKYNGLYYLTYAAFAHQGTAEQICYATATKITGPWIYRGILTGYATKSYTIHPAVVEFKKQWYLFYHNAALTLPDGQTGGTGRRSVCVDYLYYNADGTIQPVKQTVEGVSVPPAHVFNVPVAPKPVVVVDGGAQITENTAPGALRWAGNPVMATLKYPDSMAVNPISFNGEGHTSLAQTFTVSKNFKLAKICLFAGDGYDADSPIVLGLYDLGTDSITTDLVTCQPGVNMLGNGKGIRIAYTVQAPGLFTIDLTDLNKVALQTGHKYLFELQGKRKSETIFWRSSQRDVYKAGAAYLDYKLLKDRNGNTCDFAMSIYESK